MKTFDYEGNKNCYFVVNSYLANKEAMAIEIYKKGELLKVCTLYDDMGMYSEHITTIKNYSENSHMTDFLMKLGIVEDILFRCPCNSYVYDSIKTDNPQTKDTCIINTDLLKEYSKEWNYNV